MNLLLPSKCHGRCRSKFKPRNQKTAFTVARQNTACIAYIIGIHVHGQEVDISGGAFHVHITMHLMWVWKIGCQLPININQLLCYHDLHQSLKQFLGPSFSSPLHHPSPPFDASRWRTRWQQRQQRCLPRWQQHPLCKAFGQSKHQLLLEMSPMFRCSVFLSRPISI